MKYLRVTFSNGEVYDIPAKTIALQRASYFAARDATKGDSRYDTICEQEFRFAMEDDYEIQDWAFNNMDWEDVKQSAVCVYVNKADYHREWPNANNVIIDKNENHKSENSQTS